MERGPRNIFNPEADAVFGDALDLRAARRQPPRATTCVTGTYSQNWLPGRYFERRTSLIDRPCGRPAAGR